MAPQEFFITIHRGITAGFAPSRGDHEIASMARSKDAPQDLMVQRAKGHNVPENITPTKRPWTTKEEALVDQLHDILKGLPVEDPPGSDDIYGEGVSIMFGSEDLEWFNRVPEGIASGNSEVKATEEQKAKFKQAVEIVTQLTAE